MKAAFLSLPYTHWHCKKTGLIAIFHVNLEQPSSFFLLLFLDTASWLTGRQLAQVAVSLWWRFSVCPTSHLIACKKQCMVCTQIYSLAVRTNAACKSLKRSCSFEDDRDIARPHNVAARVAMPWTKCKARPRCSRPTAKKFCLKPRPKIHGARFTKYLTIYIEHRITHREIR